MYLYIDKLPPPEEEDPKKAAAKAAPKKGAAEELKPVHGKVWLDLSLLAEPGQYYLDLKQTVETILPSDGSSTETIYENSNTYLSYRIRLSEPLYNDVNICWPLNEFQGEVMKIQPF